MLIRRKVRKRDGGKGKVGSSITREHFSFSKRQQEQTGGEMRCKRRWMMRRKMQRRRKVAFRLGSVDRVCVCVYVYA